MNFRVKDKVVCVNKRGIDRNKKGRVSAVQAHTSKIKVVFEDGTESVLQAACNFEHCEGKKKRGEGDEDDNKEGDEKEEDEKEYDLTPLFDSDDEDKDYDQSTSAA
jgi:hypothetical protein